MTMHDPALRDPVRASLPGQVRSPVATPDRGLSRRDIHGTGPVRPGGGAEFAAYRARIRVLRVVWTVAFLALIFGPLLLAPEAGGERRPWSKGGIWVELCMTSGLLGLSTLAASIVLPSRVKSLTKAFGIEEVLRSHRWLATVTAILVVAHVLFIVIDKPLNVLLLSPMGTGANRARAGLVATVAMVLLCVLSFRRKQIGTRYDVWRWVHAMLAIAALVGTYMHIFWLNHLMQNIAERVVMWAILIAVSAVLINRWVLRPFASLRNPYVVRSVTPVTPTVSQVVLSPARRRQPPLDYRPGQFAWIRMDSPFGPLQSNPFTISSGTDSPRDVEFTIRDAGDFTAAVRALTPGRKVYVDGPYGSFNSDFTGGGSILLIAGGVGMAPMMSILRSHAFRGDRRPHCLIMSARSPEELMYREELDELGAELDLRIIEAVSAPPPGWEGVRGRINPGLLDSVLGLREFRDTQAFICGPPQLMTDVKDMLLDLGLPEGRIHTEQFDMV